MTQNSNYAEDHKRTGKARLSLRINSTQAEFVDQAHQPEFDNVTEFYKAAIRQAVINHPKWEEWSKRK